MLKKLQTFASLYRELGLRWSAFRLAYAFRLRIGLVRLQMPMGEWSDYKKHITSKPAGRVVSSRFVSRNISKPALTKEHKIRGLDTGWKSDPTLVDHHRNQGVLNG